MMAVVKDIAAAIYVFAIIFVIIYGFGVIFGWGFWNAMPDKIKVELVPKERAGE